MTPMLIQRRAARLVAYSLGAFYQIPFCWATGNYRHYVFSKALKS